MSAPYESTGFMRELLLRGQFSDMEIICQDVTFKAHRAIVCTQSRFFNSALCDGFKESLDGSINLREETPETIERVLSFLYLKEYDEDVHTVPFRPTTRLVAPAEDPNSDCQEDVPERQEDMPDCQEDNPDCEEDEFNTTEALRARALNNILVFNTADKFGIGPLKHLASEKFSKWLSENWDSPIFPQVVEETLALVPSHETTLQEIIAGVISKHVFEFMSKATILPVLCSFGSLGSLVILSLVQSGRVKKPTEYYLPRETIKKLNSCNQCGHCSAKLNVRLEGRGAFRCANCKHGIC